MRAKATVVAERGARRKTRCTTLRSAPPLSLRDTPQGLHLVGSCGGPLGGDDVHLDVTVADGASLTVRSVAAQVVLPGPRQAPSLARVEVSVAAGATLRWRPEPLVLAGGADHRAVMTLTLEDGAAVEWREEVVLGRNGEASGSLLQRLRVDRGGRPLLRSDLAVGPRWPGSAGPAGCGDARVVGTLLVVGERARSLGLEVREGVRAAACRLGDDAILVTALAHSHELLHQVLAGAEQAEVHDVGRELVPSEEPEGHLRGVGSSASPDPSEMNPPAP